MNEMKCAYVHTIQLNPVSGSQRAGVQCGHNVVSGP